jgi:predicted house-cleaning noncanonical NTP pyrophosphatase (MazG superfamily)
MQNTFKGEKYPILKEKINILTTKSLLSKEDIDNLYNNVVEEFKEMGNNPDLAKMSDVMEIADASGFKVPETDKKRNDNDIYNG